MRRIRKKFSDVASGKIKLSDLGQTGNANIDKLLGYLGQKADNALDKGSIILKMTKKFAKYSGEWLIMGLIVWWILSKIGGDGSKKQREWNSKRSSN